MVEFTEQQHERAIEQLQRYQSRARKHERLYKEEKVEENLPTFFSGLARKYTNSVILSVYVDRIAQARDHFRRAAEYYRRSAEESNVTVPSTLTLARGLYNASLAGDPDMVQEFAREVTKIIETVDVEPGDSDDDRYYFSGCLADAVLDDIREWLLSGLAAVNEEKPEIHALYGKAILTFTCGIRDKDVDQIQKGIRIMLKYHSQSSNEENVVERVMAPQATALLIITLWKGYEIQLESEFIPMELVRASTSKS
ncbi:hypothetical protein [Natronobeatus ordinarius]|uniref:hypothetical protein n=1 Tax=Natronobeatus ordinarius TaxID=2963433 RepID=UPI0020CDD36D|nr:hypothetical protein [Natronobeatus ordinarius]